jgi:hypothetical protein
MFRVMVTDIAENISLWLESTDTPIKIDTDVPSISDVSSPTENIFMATNAENLILDFGRNG